MGNSNNWIKTKDHTIFVLRKLKLVYIIVKLNELLNILIYAHIIGIKRINK